MRPPSAAPQHVLGLDIGGSGIKAGVVHVASGKLVSERLRVPTPHPARPAPMARAVRSIVDHLNWRGPVGVGFPGIVRNQIVCSAANLDRAWLGLDAGKIFRRATRRATFVLNDADAAGLAEVMFGSARGKRGTVVMLTLGTGIGSALFRDGALVPNLELGHLQFHSTIAEKYAAAAVRKNEDLTWRQWARRLNNLLRHVEFLFSPDLIVLGGGVSTKFEKYERFLDRDVPIVPARLENRAGIVGAAIAAAKLLPPRTTVRRNPGLLRPLARTVAAKRNRRR